MVFDPYGDGQEEQLGFLPLPEGESWLPEEEIVNRDDHKRMADWKIEQYGTRCKLFDDGRLVVNMKISGADPQGDWAGKEGEISPIWFDEERLQQEKWPQYDHMKFLTHLLSVLGLAPEGGWPKGDVAAVMKHIAEKWDELPGRCFVAEYHWEWARNQKTGDLFNKRAYFKWGKDKIRKSKFDEGPAPKPAPASDDMPF